MDGEFGPQETQFICPLLMESIKRINSTEMNPVGDLENSNNFYVEDENDTRIVRNIFIKDANDSSSVVAIDPNPFDPIFHTACALLLVSYLAPTYSR